MKHWILLGWMMILGLVFVAGCENDHDDAALVNTWTRHVVDDQGREFDASIQFFASGDFTFNLLSPTTGHTSSLLKYRIDGERITFYDDSECGTAGVYKYSISGSELRLVTDNDPCSPRAGILQALWYMD
jgi:hypothetical protein